MEPWSPLEAALVSFHDRGEPAAVTVRTDFADPESLAAEVFFRPERAFEPRESMALARCGPRVLVLQERGHRVTGLEILPEAVRIMRERGVRDARLGTIFEETRFQSSSWILTRWPNGPWSAHGRRTWSGAETGAATWLSSPPCRVVAMHGSSPGDRWSGPTSE